MPSEFKRLVGSSWCPTVFSAIVINLHKLLKKSVSKLSDKESLAIDFLLSGLTSFWEISPKNKKLVGKILERWRALTPEDQGILLSWLIDYYESGDKIVGHEVDHIDRKLNRDVPEGERPLNILEFREDKAEKRGFQRGIEQGIEQGIERNKGDTALRLLRMGIDQKRVIKATGIKASALRDLIRKSKH